MNKIGWIEHVIIDRKNIYNLGPCRLKIRKPEEKSVKTSKAVFNRL
jgi:hypothetical protein